jgi:hypothetical protein
LSFSVGEKNTILFTADGGEAETLSATVIAAGKEQLTNLTDEYWRTLVGGQSAG